MALLKSSIPMSIWGFASQCFSSSCVVRRSCVSQEWSLQKLWLAGINIPLLSRCPLMCVHKICSASLHTIQVSDMGRYFLWMWWYTLVVLSLAPDIMSEGSLVTCFDPPDNIPFMYCQCAFFRAETLWTPSSGSLLSWPWNRGVLFSRLRSSRASGSVHQHSSWGCVPSSAASCVFLKHSSSVW